MTRRTRAALVLAVLAALAAGVALSTRKSAGTPPTSPTRGRLVAAVRAEPRSFNRLVARDRASLVVSQLLHARLIQLNHTTQEAEPALAERWTLSDDKRTYTFSLRRGVTFSDGAPFTADDVAFTFQAMYDARSGSPLADAFTVNGKPFDCRVVDAHTLTLTLAAPLAPLPRLLNSLPVLPAHKLRAALEGGRLREAWSIATPPAEMAGLGPFVVDRYVPGQRLELVRNTRYWRTTAAGQPGELPRLDRLTLRVMPDQQAELLAFEAGELDLLNGEVRPEDLAAMRRLAQAGRARVSELGVAVDADSLWFNLGPAQDGRPDSERPWLDDNFRRAVSHAINRQQFVDTVMLGAGTPIQGPITPGNRLWFDASIPQDAFDLARARTLLAAAGLADRDGNGILDTRSGKPVRIDLFTQRGHAMRERAASVIKADLKTVGLDVNVVTFDAPTLGERLTKGAYDCAFFGINVSDIDPSTNLDYWLSSGSFHVWHPLQKTPATPWEAEIDRLMREVTVLDEQGARKERFNRVQRLFAEHAPAIFFAAPIVAVATSPRVEHAEPGLLFPFVLWRADTLAATPAGPPGTN